VTVTEVPNVGYQFDHWEIAGTSVGTDNAFKFTIQTDLTIRSVFKRVFNLNIVVTPGQGGTVAKQPDDKGAGYSDGRS